MLECTDIGFAVFFISSELRWLVVVFFYLTAHWLEFTVIIFCLCVRVLLDRAHTDLDDICRSLDSNPKPESLASLIPSSPLRNSNASTSETNTSDPASSPHLPSSSSPLSSSSSQTPVDLSQILLNITSCRWRHFRPRTLSHHPLAGGDLSRRGFRDFSRTVSGLTRTLSGGANSQNRTGPASTPVNGESFVSSITVMLLSVYCQLYKVGDWQ